MLRRLLVVLVPLAVGCGGPPPPGIDAGVALKCHEQPFAAMGGPVVLDARLTANLFMVPLTIGATQKSAVVDTGAPITLLDPAGFPSENLPQGQGTVPRLTLGSLSVTDPSVVGAPVGAATPDGPVFALLGGDFLCHFATGFDYRQPRVFLGDSPLPTDLAAPISVPALVLGGGRGALQSGGQTVAVKIQRTRLVVTGSLDGIARTFIIDTGATLNVVSQAAFRELTADGRKTIAGLEASTVMGTQGLTVTRARVSLGAAEAQGVLVASIDSTIFANLAAEVGRPVDGLLGGTFQREFFFTVDYAGEQVALRRYPTRAHVRDEFTRAGFAMAPIPTAPAGMPAYRVSVVFPASDAAAQQLTVGTNIVSIDGTSLEGLRVDVANELLLGAAGTTKAVRTSTSTVMVRVEDLLGR